MVDKRAINQVMDKSGEWAKDRWSSFRRESPYFQARVWLILGYVAIVALTIMLAPPEGQHWFVKAERLGFGLSFKTALRITNVDNGDLEEHVVEVKGKAVEFDGREIPGVWRTKPMTIPEGTDTKVLTEQLFDDKGVSPPYALNAALVTIYDDDGEVVLSVAPQQVGSP